ncbi:MAG TPA: sugar phosphate isomerase/epimerase [Vicinamibacterales bacterium]
MTISRRDVLGLLPMSAALWTSQLHAQAAYPPRIGVQLYTLRNQLDRLDETLRTVAELGFSEVETLRPVLPLLPPLLAKHKLTAPSGHFDAPLITGNRELWGKLAPPPLPPDYTVERAIEQAKAAGLKYFVLAYLMPPERQSLDDYRRYADRMNEVGRQCREAGLQFCYHHHAFEFAPLQGERPWDLLLARWDKDLVALEVDVFWLASAGLDPAGTIRELGPRVKLLHLKDRARGQPVALDEAAVPPAAFAEVGNGSLDFPAILRAAREVGVQHFFVEQDHVPGEPAASLRQSITYLRSLKI